MVSNENKCSSGSITNVFNLGSLKAFPQDVLHGTVLGHFEEPHLVGESLKVLQVTFRLLSSGLSLAYHMQVNTCDSKCFS